MEKGKREGGRGEKLESRSKEGERRGKRTDRRRGRRAVRGEEEFGRREAG